MGNWYMGDIFIEKLKEINIQECNSCHSKYFNIKFDKITKESENFELVTETVDMDDKYYEEVGYEQKPIVKITKVICLKCNHILYEKKLLFLKE